MKNNNISFNVALGGITAAVSLLLMFMTSLFPMLDFALPAAAGALLAVIVIEINKKWALTAYATVAVLSMFIVPSKESGLLFVLFMGYYPIVKSAFERLKKPYLQWALKYLLFNVAVVAYYFVTMRFVTDASLMEDAGKLGKYTAVALLLLANAVFAVYDIALTRLISMYYNSFRKRFLRK